MDEELKQIIKQNQQLLQGLNKKVKKIEKKLHWQAVGSFLKIVLILAPIIFGVIYLSPYVKQYVGYFKPLLETLNLAPGNSILQMGNKEPVDNQADLDTDDIIQSFCDEEIREYMIQQYCK